MMSPTVTGMEATPDDPLPWRVAESIPYSIHGEIHRAWRAEGGDRARQSSRKSPYLPSDKAHHQDHGGARDRLGEGEEVGEFLVRHPAIGAGNEIAHVRQNRRKAAKADGR
jgi:hypothetical protein